MDFNLKKSIEILERTPQVLQDLLQNLSKDWIHSNEGGESWSVFDFIGHLIHGEKTDWMERTHIILDNSENKTFQSFNRLAQFKNSKGKSLSNLLNEFSELRNKNIVKLKALNLEETQLSMKGIHPELGEVNLKQLLATWVTHDLGHIAQMARVMAKQYQKEVGPWNAYIPILNR